MVTTWLWLLAACQLPQRWLDVWPDSAGFPRGGTVTIALPDPLTVVQPWQITNRTVETFVALTHAGLMRLDVDGMPQPELLADWSVSADQTVITATLKADLRWSDDAPLTSDDVVFSYTTFKSIPATTPLLNELSVVESITRVDEARVRFALVRPYAGILSMWALPVLPAHVLAAQQVTQVNMHNLLVSAGPFTYKETSSDGAVTLVANPHYVLGAPLLDGIVLRLGLNAQQMTSAVVDGSVDIAELSSASQIPATAAMSTTTYAQNSMYALVFNMRDAHPTSDVVIRQALAAHLANDARDIFVPHSWAYQAITTTVQLDAAETLLDADGWMRDATSGMRIREQSPLTISLLVPRDNAVLMDAADALAQQWQSLGITTQRQNVSRDVYLSALIPPYAYDVMLVEFAQGRSSSEYADILYYDPDVRALFDGAQRNDGIPNIRGSLNLSGIQDSTVNAALARIQTTYDATARRHLYTELITALRAQLPIAVLQRPYVTVVYGTKLQATTGSMQFNSPWYVANAMRWYLQSPPE